LSNANSFWSCALITENGSDLLEHKLIQ